MLARYKAQFIIRMLERFSSRGTVVMNLLANSLILLLTYFFWKAFSSRSSSQSLENFTQNTLLTYTVISVILRSLIVTFGTTLRIGNMIQDGTIIGIILKPFNFLEYWMFDQLSRVVFSIFTLSIPMVLLTILLEPNMFNNNFNFLAFIISSLIALYISTILNVIMGLSGFWFERSSSFHQLNILLYEFTSGMMIPLDIYPALIKRITYFLPYRAIIDIPLKILVGNNYSLIYIQLFWAVLLTCIYMFIFKKGCSRLEGVGV